MKHYGARQPMVQRSQSVTNATVKVSIATGMAGKEYMMISNIGDGTCYIGGSGVTAATGYVLRPRAGYDWGQCTSNFSFHVVTVTTTTTKIGIYES